MALTTPTTPMYLMDFACLKPPENARTNVDICTMAVQHPDNRPFFRKVLLRSGLDPEGTYIAPDSHPHVNPSFNKPEWKNHENEAAMLYFGCMDELFKKGVYKPSDIDILITVASTYCPIPSLASRIIQHYKLREDVRGYHLGGMGCSMGVVTMELVHDLLKARPGSNIVTVFSEFATSAFYNGKDENFIVANALFRMGSVCCVFSDKMWFKNQQAKLQLKQFVRVHVGGKYEGAYECIQRRTDDEGHLGLYLSKELPQFVSKAVARVFKIVTPKIMTWSQVKDFCVTGVKKSVYGKAIQPYKPDYTKCCNHFLIHAGGYAVLKSLQKGLSLPSDYMIPSFATLRDYGNLSASTTWYSLAYLESIGAIKANQVVMQLGIGSGIKVGLAVWKAVRDVKDDHVAWRHLGGKALTQEDLPRRIDEEPRAPAAAAVVQEQ